MNTKTLGIVGGLGPESTVDYYQSIIALFRERVKEDSYPRLIINSLDVSYGIKLVTNKAYDELIAYLTTAFQQLAQAGATIGLMAANTPHIVFDDVAGRSPIPLISIVRATFDEVRKTGLRRLALLGTAFTMNGGFYQRVFDRSGVDLVVPTEDQRTLIHQKYMGELLHGTFLDSSRAQIIAIIEDLKKQHQIDGVILAGTELPLLLRGSDVSVPFLDTTQIHVKVAVDEILKR